MTGSIKEHLRHEAIVLTGLIGLALESNAKDQEYRKHLTDVKLAVERFIDRTK